MQTAGSSRRIGNVTRLWIAVLLLCATPGKASDAFASDEAWLEVSDATGTWSGQRTRLEDNGVHIDLDFTGEAFAQAGAGESAYRGNLDLMLTLDTRKLGLWSGGSILVYGETAHGRGVSQKINALQAVSSLEAQSFTQVAELWIDQRLGEHLHVRLGKQDANRDFSGSRYVGNFINASFGVNPTIPMPSFPSPGLGCVLFFDPLPLVGLRGGVYQGETQVGSFVGPGFSDSAGLFGIGALVIHHNLFDRPSGSHTVGAWNTTIDGRFGAYGNFDMRFFFDPRDANDERSLQIIARVGWAGGPPADPSAIDRSVGGAATLHGVLGTNNTLGIGGVYARNSMTDETFVELFYKIRTIAWFTIEPNVQVYFQPDQTEWIMGLRTKLKL